MKTILLLTTLLAITSLPLAADPPAPPPLTLADGRKFDDAQVTAADPWTLLVRHADGAATITTALLTADDLARLAPQSARDGRFWHERAVVLWRAWETTEKKQLLHVALAEVQPHAAEIARYLEARDAALARAKSDAEARRRSVREQKLREWEIVNDPDTLRQWMRAVRREQYVSGQ